MRRGLLIALVVPMAVLLWANARWLLGMVYGGIALTTLDTPSISVAANTAAVKFAPWRPGLHTNLARGLMLDARDPAVVKQAFAGALAWSPSDGYLWHDYAQILAALGEFDGVTELAVTRTNELAPAAPTLQASNARLGLRHWYRGSDAMQREWLASMSYELRHRPKKFLKIAAADGGMYWFCASAALDLPLTPWCNYLWNSYELGLLPLPTENRP